MRRGAMIRRGLPAVVLGLSVWLGMGGGVQAATHLEEAIALDPYFGVRSEGLGGAYAALIPIVPEGRVNPAGLTALAQRGAAFSLDIPVDSDGPSALALAYGQPDRGYGGGLVGWVYNPVLLHPNASGSDYYVRKTRISYALGRRIRGVVGQSMRGAERRSLMVEGLRPAAGALQPDTLAYGIEFHYDRLYNEETEASASAWGVGLGVMYQYNRGIRLGLHLPNAYQTSFQWDNDVVTDSPGHRPVIGIAYQADPDTLLALDWEPRADLVLGTLQGGIEYWALENLAFRVGGELNDTAGERTWSAGFSWQPLSWKLNMAYERGRLFVSSSYAF